VRGTVVVTVHGEVGMDDWRQVDRILVDLIDDQGNLDVLLDLRGVPRLERAAAPLILEAARQAHAHGGRLRFVSHR
jgi:anti-anti-sigma regulatory factor